MNKKTKILVLGDSHANIYSSRYIKFLLPNFEFKTISVKGATISGIQNPNSITQSKFFFDEALELNKNIKYCILLLGEVDTGFVLWYKQQESNININELLQLTINKYKNFIQQVDKLGYSVIVQSTPLPTIKDNCEFGEIANLRKSIKSTQVERTNLTLSFNSQIKKYCKLKGHQHISLDEISLSKKGVVKKILRHYSKKNHHYNPIIYSLIIALNLKKLNF